MKIWIAQFVVLLVIGSLPHLGWSEARETLKSNLSFELCGANSLDTNVDYVCILKSDKAVVGSEAVSVLLVILKTGEINHYLLYGFAPDQVRSLEVGTTVLKSGVLDVQDSEVRRSFVYLIYSKGAPAFEPALDFVEGETPAGVSFQIRDFTISSPN